MKRMLLSLGFLLVLTLTGCESSGGSGGAASAGASGRYGGWSTGQLQAKRTELLRESSQQGLSGSFDGSSVENYRRSQLNQEIAEVNAELASRGVD